MMKDMSEVIKIWEKATDDVNKRNDETTSVKINPIFMMVRLWSQR